MPGVHLDGPTNSTMFTNCCRCAITDREADCPQCKAEITPRSSEGRWNSAYGPIRRGARGYGHPVTAAIMARKDSDNG